MNQLARNDNDIAMLQSAMLHGASNLRTIPSMVKLIIHDEEWRERELAVTGERVKFRSFAAFVQTSPPRGLGSTIDQLKSLCAADGQARDLIDQALKRPPGRPNTLDNIQDIDAPTGTSKDAALRRLRKDRPDLHALVIAGGLSPHAAMVSAGFRRRTVNVPDDIQAAARVLRKHFDVEALIAALREDGE